MKKFFVLSTLAILASLAAHADKGRSGCGTPQRFVHTCSATHDTLVKGMTGKVTFKTDIQNALADNTSTTFSLTLSDSTPMAEWGTDRTELAAGFINRKAAATFPGGLNAFGQDVSNQDGFVRVAALTSLIRMAYPDLSGKAVSSSNPLYEEVRFKTKNPVWPTVIIRGIMDNDKFSAMIEGADGTILYDGKPWDRQNFFQGTLNCVTEVFPKCKE